MASKIVEFLARRASWLWVPVVLLAALGIAHSLAHQTPWGQPWEQSNVILLDFRDTITAPGRFLMHGGNPYDPDTYLTAHPWAQEFDPYAPMWFLMAAPLSLLPAKLSALVYLVLATLVLAWVTRTLTRLAVPQWAAWLAPLAMMWFLVWYPTRVLGSSFLCAAGFVLAVAALARDRTNQGWLPALGLAIMLIKPQLGLWAVIMVAAVGLWRLALRAVALMVALSLPALVACIVSAGGVVEFARSILRVVEHASSPESPTGLLGSESYRSDIPGMYMRIQGAQPPTWLMALTVALFALACLAVWWLRPRIALFVLMVVPAVLVMPVHATYDIILAAVAAAFAWRYAIQHPSRLAWAMAILVSLPVLHMHRVTAALGIGRNLADSFDLLCCMVAGVLAMALAHQERGGRALAAREVDQETQC